MSSPEGPPPPPDPQRILGERRTGAAPSAQPPWGPDEPEGGDPTRRWKIAVILLAALALGLGVATGLIASAPPDETVLKRTTTETERLKPTTTVTTVSTTPPPTTTTVVTTNKTVTETQMETETVTETVEAPGGGPPGD